MGTYTYDTQRGMLIPTYANTAQAPTTQLPSVGGFNTGGALSNSNIAPVTFNSGYQLATVPQQSGFGMNNVTGALSNAWNGLKGMFTASPYNFQNTIDLGGNQITGQFGQRLDTIMANDFGLKGVKFSSLDQNTQNAILNQANNASPTGLQGAFGNGGWAVGALGGIGTLGNLYLGYQGLKTQKRALNEQTALARANYRNTARQVNTQYRDQMSGRGYNGMSANAKGALGREYNNRRVEETY